MKSGHNLGKRRRPAGGTASHRSLRTHAASGERSAPFARMNPVEESNPTPVPSRLVHAKSCPRISKFRRPVSAPVGAMTISSPSAVRSIRRLGFNAHNSKSPSSSRGSGRRTRAGNRRSANSKTGSASTVVSTRPSGDHSPRHGAGQGGRNACGWLGTAGPEYGHQGSAIPPVLVVAVGATVLVQEDFQLPGAWGHRRFRGADPAPRSAEGGRGR